MNGISISYDLENGVLLSSQFEKVLNASPDDIAIVRHFSEVIHRRSPAADLLLERRADGYLSLCVGPTDFLRFKFTPHARWVSVDVSGIGVSPDDPRFVAQKNKNQRFWKALISDISDLSSFDDIVFEAFLNCSKIKEIRS